MSRRLLAAICWKGLLCGGASVLGYAASESSPAGAAFLAALAAAWFAFAIFTELDV